MAHLENTKRCVIKLLYLISNENEYKGKVIFLFLIFWKIINNMTLNVIKNIGFNPKLGRFPLTP